MLKVHQIPQLEDNYAYVLVCENTRTLAVVDSPESQPILDFCQAQDLKVSKILNTHHHSDHVGSNRGLMEVFPHLEIYGYGDDASRIPGITHRVNEGDEVKVGDSTAKVLFNPGHTLGHISYYFPQENMAFVGDTLFATGCGRLFEGTPQQMEHSMRSVIGSLPRDTTIYCAHEYTLANLKFALSVEPHNEKLLARLEESKKLRDAQKPTVPFTLEKEWETNPFMRVDQPQVIAHAQKNGAKDTSPVEIFRVIRSLKDNF